MRQSLNRLFAGASSPGCTLKRIPLDVFVAERGLPYDFILEEMTRLNLFDADTSSHDFEHGKPHPTIFLTAPQEPGFLPEHSFVVEDASSGAQAARASGGGD